MKKSFWIRLLAMALLVGLCAGALTVRAEELWSEEYYRAADSTGNLSDAERDSLDEDCLAFVEAQHLDIALVAVEPADYAGGTLEDLAETYYEDCGYGYGSGRDGFLLVYVTGEERVELFCFGAARGRIPQDYLEQMLGSAVGYRKDYGVFGVLYAGLRSVSQYIEEHPAEQTISLGDPERAGADSGKPAWYPADPANFQFYHDEAAPRVVDAADIFSDGEERQLEARLAELRAELGKDVVVYTDTSSYGLGHDVCAADFYDFNGYGIGPEREGVCLFICMDPADRGWWTCCTGPDTMALYTQDAASAMDEALYEFLSAGQYARGAADWAENFRTLVLKGFPFAPDWLPDRGETFTRFQDSKVSRIVDDAMLLTASEKQTLAQQAAEISRKYGLDVVIHTTSSSYGMELQDYADQFFYYNGYGTGAGYDGLLLTVFYRSGYYCAARLTASGAGSNRLSETNADRLLTAVRDKIDGDEAYAGLSQWLRQVSHMEKTGRVPRSAGYWAGTAAVSCIIGALAGLVLLLRAKVKMRNPRTQVDADYYLDKGRMRISGGGDRYLYTSTSQRYAPVQQRSSGGGGGGGGHSSFSGGYSGSSGSSHSGSGGKF